MPYVYRHVRNDKNVPFYIGISSTVNHKRAFSTCQRSNHWHSVVAKTSFRVEILLDGLSMRAACEKEKYFIKLYGRSDLNRGTLVNMTDGGEGSPKVIWREESLRKMSEKLKGRKFSDEHRRKLSLNAKNRKYSEEHCKKMSERAKGRTFTAERNKKVSDGLKRVYTSGERIPSMLGKSLSAETILKIRIAKKNKQKRIFNQPKIKYCRQA